MSASYSFCLIVVTILKFFVFFADANITNVELISPLSSGKHFIFTVPSLCSPAKKWNFNGRDLVNDYKGRILLLAFIPLGCGEQCEKQIEKYKFMIERLNGDVRILIIARYTEQADLVRQVAGKLPIVRIEHEKKEAMVWSWLGAKEHDHFIFDRCSRLAKFVHHNQTNPIDDNFNETILALRLAIDYPNCGWCEYDPLKQSSNTSTIQASHKSQVLTLTPEVQPPKITINIHSKSLHESEDRSTFKTPGPQHNPKDSVVGQQLQGEIGQLPSQQTQQYTRSTTTTSTFPQLAYQAQMQQHQQELARQREEQQRILQYHHQQRQLQEQQHRQESYYSQPGPPQQQQQHVSQPSHYKQSISQQQHKQYMPATNSLQVNQLKNYRHAPQQTQNFDSHFDGKLTTTPAPKIQYSKDMYNNRYQYRLGERPSGGSNSYRDTERQKEYDQKQHQIKVQQQKKDQAKQLAELQRQHHIQQQLALQQQNQLLLQKQKQQEEQEKKKEKKKGAIGAEPAPLYPEGSEDYYEDYNSEWTTVIPQLQIPTPTSHPLWPTIAVMSEMGKDYGLELPCASYTDEICYQQQNQLKPAEVHKCCKERILLTDQCVPGKCSNITQQLCCIQKFLQAKLTCCMDERQLDETVPGDRFSHCCFTNFIGEEDTCCNSIYANTQWRHIHELCLPNIQMDLSKVKVPTILSGTTLVTEYDFGKTEKWRFECKYGSQVPQFSYFEEEDDYNNGKLPYAKK